MNVRLLLPLVYVVGIIAVCGHQSSAAPPDRTLPLDPVELLAGKDVPGKPELSLERDGIAYMFASPENKAVFEKDPAKYEVADGGACGRMGPLSGMGDARRYAVHAGRIYLFASDGCRTAFLRDPSRYIESDDDKVFGSNDQVVCGRALLDKAVAWAGGAEKLRGLKTFRATAARKEKHGETEYAVSNELVLRFPDAAYQREAWNESWHSTMVGPDGDAMATSQGTERMAASRGRAFRRSMARQPLVILKAYVDGAPKSDCPGLIVVADGTGKVGETQVEYLKVWLNGAASRLGVDPTNGKILQLSFRGRDGTSKIGESVRTYTGFATVQGLTIPSGYSVIFDGKDMPSAGAKFDAFEVNPVVAKDLFKIE